MTERCSKCGYKIRGKNHENGEHHTNKRVPKSRRKAKK